MRMTFVAEAGVDSESRTLGRIEYDTAEEYRVAVLEAFNDMWGTEADGTRAGYEEFFEHVDKRIDDFIEGDEFVSHLVVPYGYIILTK